MNARSKRPDIGWVPLRRTWGTRRPPLIGVCYRSIPARQAIRRFFYVRISMFTRGTFRIRGYRPVRRYICGKYPVDMTLMVRIPFCYPMVWARRAWRFARFIKQKSWIGYHPGNRGQYGLVINEGGRWFGVCIRYVPSNNWIQIYFVIIWRHKPHRFSKFIEITNAIWST